MDALEMGGELFGIPVYVDREFTITSKHPMIISGIDVSQCLECGRWTTKGLTHLQSTECPGDTGSDVIEEV